jgi:uncharacterized membrane protein
MASCASLFDHPSKMQGSGKETARTFHFECEGKYVFVARVEDAHAWLFLEDVTVNLPRRPSVSGEKYQSTDYIFWIKGNQARLESSDGKSRQCKNDRARAVWEAARLNGVDFRAVGNEPGWFMELDDDLLVLETDYGASRYEFSTPPADVDVNARLTRYQAAEDGWHLLLELKGTQCMDTMSGEMFPTRVSVTLNGRVFQGCGRALY